MATQQGIMGESQMEQAFTSKTGRMKARPSASLAVFTWELRHRLFSRSTWIIGLFLVICALGLSWLGQSKDWMDQPANIDVAGTTAFGLMYEMPGVLMLWFAILLPFLSADAVADDIKNRMHEMSMVTPVSSRAYVVGRFLASLVISLLMAVLLLVSVMAIATLLHAQFSTYPEPDYAVIVLMWALVVLPALCLLCGASFMLGTLWPTFTGAAKAVVLVIWLFIWSLGIGLGSTPLGPWDPTSNALSHMFKPYYLALYQAGIQHATSTAERWQVAHSVQGTLPDLTLWIITHVLYVMLGLALVWFAVRRFKRFSDAL